MKEISTTIQMCDASFTQKRILKTHMISVPEGNKPLKCDICSKNFAGGVHVVAKIIRELKSHMIPYKFKCSHWLKLQHSDSKAIFHQ